MSIVHKSTKKYQTIINAEEQHLMTMSNADGSTLEKSTKTFSKNSVHSQSSEEKNSICEIQNLKRKSKQYHLNEKPERTQNSQETLPTTASTFNSGDILESDFGGSDIVNKENNKISSKKLKGKKNKNIETDKHNISVKSSFSKFDALQKRNLINCSKSENETNCHLCSKPVYKMEEIKAEKFLYHKNCFRCYECSKQLKVDNYQSNDGVMYCIMHFKLLFAPKCVEGSEQEKPKKPELIIRENQPEELPPDIVRASIKSDLGLEELHQLNVRSRFQLFEKKNGNSQGNNAAEGTGILVNTKNEKGNNASISDSDYESKTVNDAGEIIENEYVVRSIKSVNRELPVGLGETLNTIKNKFETGHAMSKEERREERKQEIQNIRSRLFMGKQARIKEMYQQAVADSEQVILAADKKPDIEIEGNARNLKERFEKGEMFNDNDEVKPKHTSTLQDEADVFESAISKNSRNIFMELDANVSTIKPITSKIESNNNNFKHYLNKRGNDNKLENAHVQQDPNLVIKYDEKPDDFKIKTSEISEKFKFFETYKPTKCQKKSYRISPSREVVKMPYMDSEDEININIIKDDINIETIAKSNTTTTILNKFREMEQKKFNRPPNSLKPLKCFTPPRDCVTNGYQNEQENESCSDTEEDEETDEDNNKSEDKYELYTRLKHVDDEALKEAHAAARAKKLKEKFEKWEVNEIQREINEGLIGIYSQGESDDSALESTKTLRERFENLKNTEKGTHLKPRYQVNRFV